VEHLEKKTYCNGQFGLWTQRNEENNSFVNVHLSLSVMQQTLGGHPQMTSWSKGGQGFYDDSVIAELTEGEKVSMSQSYNTLFFSCSLT